MGKKAGSKSRTVTSGEKLGTDVTNITGHVQGKTLHLQIELDQDHGKTPKNFRRIATTHGNVAIPGHPTIKIGLNCYDTAE